ncbi:Phage regulatory protein Rha (Phage_pRha) [Sodalis glossinidius str. 'morsitans']|uniref:Phage regulatory protein Rha (Phage_pRha) n=2 Tax=Sodalis glossinidius (strain morsitans) TaxID=343509 RepID=A0A193QHX9_SODGM|nr:Rha family transcriptional regulator [Sodalis glossinidius]CRL44784.1 Phage regulatory protein Rha (Phage_pRha) [Sodalis glossinidius str. 'morsitans']
MQNLTIAQTLTMSSREIAELVGKRHDHVIRNVWEMLEQLYQIEKDAPNLGNHKNQKVTIIEGVIIAIDGRGYVGEFLLDRRHTEILITGYDVKRRATVIDRWFALESGKAQAITAAPALPENYISALEALLESKKSEAKLALVNKKQEKEIHCLQNLFQVGMTPVQFCKQLNGVNIIGVNLFLEERNFLYDGQKEENKPYEWRVKAYARDKYFTEKTVTIPTEKGKKKFYEVILLKEGAKWLYRHYLKKELPMKKSWNGLFTHDKYFQVA